MKNHNYATNTLAKYSQFNPLSVDSSEVPNLLFNA